MSQPVQCKSFSVMLGTSIIVLIWSPGKIIVQDTQTVAQSVKHDLWMEDNHKNHDWFQLGQDAEVEMVKKYLPYSNKGFIQHNRLSGDCSKNAVDFCV